jgi:hypothetical protein
VITGFLIGWYLITTFVAKLELYVSTACTVTTSSNQQSAFATANNNNGTSANGCYDPNAFVVNDSSLTVVPKLKEAMLKAPSMPPDVFGDHSYAVIMSGYEFDIMNQMLLLDTKEGHQISKPSPYTNNPTQVLWQNPEGDSYNVFYGGRLYELSVYGIPFTFDVYGEYWLYFTPFLVTGIIGALVVWFGIMQRRQESRAFVGTVIVGESVLLAVSLHFLALF